MQQRHGQISEIAEMPVPSVQQHEQPCHQADTGQRHEQEVQDARARHPADDRIDRRPDSGRRAHVQQIPLHIAPDPRMQHVSVHDPHLDPRARQQRADDGAHEDARRAEPFQECDGCDQVDRRLDDGLGPVLVIQPGRRAHHVQRRAHPRHVEADDQHRHRQRVELIAFAEGQPHARLNQASQTDGAAAVQREGHKAQPVEHLAQLLLLTRGVEVAHARLHRVKGARQYVAHRRQDHRIIGIHTGHSQSHEFGNQDVVRRVDHHVPHVVAEHRPDVADDGRSLLPAEPADVLLFQERIHPIRHA